MSGIMESIMGGHRMGSSHIMGGSSMMGSPMMEG